MKKKTHNPNEKSVRLNGDYIVFVFSVNEAKMVL